MNPVSVLLCVLLVAATVLCGVAVWALTQLVATARSVRDLANDLDAKAIPLVEKADVTIDAVNAELLRIDHIVSRFEEISDRVGTTSRTVQEVATAPVEFAGEIADRVRQAWRSRKSRT